MEEFDELVNGLTDEQWWSWVKSWLDTQVISDIYDNWDDEIKQQNIHDLRMINNF
jgi:hypothetical protein